LWVNWNNHQARDDGRGLQHYDANEQRDCRICADPENVDATGLGGKIYSAQGVALIVLIKDTSTRKYVDLCRRFKPGMNIRLMLL
jgi:hypothetical protein